MLTTFAVLAVSVSVGGSMSGIVRAPVLPAVGIVGGGFAVQRQVQDLAYRLVRILGRREALAVANREEQRLAVGREGNCAAFLAALALGHLMPQHLEL